MRRAPRSPPSYQRPGVFAPLRSMRRETAATDVKEPTAVLSHTPKKTAPWCPGLRRGELLTGSQPSGPGPTHGAPAASRWTTLPTRPSVDMDRLRTRNVVAAT